MSAGEANGKGATGNQEANGQRNVRDHRIRPQATGKKTQTKEASGQRT